MAVIERAEKGKGSTSRSWLNHCHGHTGSAELGAVNLAWAVQVLIDCKDDGRLRGIAKGDIAGAPL